MTRKSQTAVENALLEGGDIVGESPLAKIPVTKDELFMRLNRELQLQDRALIASPMPRANALAAADYWLFEVELRDSGKVRRVDLIRRARELGCLEDFETPVEHWQGALVR
jgi:hypothetical protein